MSKILRTLSYKKEKKKKRRFQKCINKFFSNIPLSIYIYVHDIMNIYNDQL